MKKVFPVPLILLFVAGLVLSGSARPALAKPIKLLFATFESERGFMVEGVKAFAKDLEKKTNGKVEVEISWSQALGKIPEYYDLTVNGVCDAGFFAPPHVKGLFPLSEIVGLPHISPKAETNTKALFELHKRGYGDKALDENVKLLWMSAAQWDPLYTTDKPVTTLADCNNLKVRTSGGQHNPRVKAMGGVPVFIIGPETYIALQKKTTNAMIMSWAALRPWNLCEVLRYATFPGFGTFNFAFAMNKNSYNKLPQDVRAVIDGMAQNNEYGLIAARDYDAASERGEKCFLEKGGKIVQFEPAALKELSERFAPIWDSWIAEQEAKKLPGRETVEAFISILEGLGVKPAAVGYSAKK